MDLRPSFRRYRHRLVGRPALGSRLRGEGPLVRVERRVRLGRLPFAHDEPEVRPRLAILLGRRSREGARYGERDRRRECGLFDSITGSVAICFDGWL